MWERGGNPRGSGLGFLTRRGPCTRGGIRCMSRFAPSEACRACAVNFCSSRCGRRSERRRLEAGFGSLHFSVQSNHVHLMVEARDKAHLSKGMRGLAIRVALAVNRALRRRGRVWSDRYHARALRTPREVRNGLVYVLANWKKHLRVPRARRVLVGLVVRRMEDAAHIGPTWLG